MIEELEIGEKPADEFSEQAKLMLRSLAQDLPQGQSLKLKDYIALLNHKGREFFLNNGGQEEEKDDLAVEDFQSSELSPEIL